MRNVYSLVLIKKPLSYFFPLHRMTLLTLKFLILGSSSLFKNQKPYTVWTKDLHLEAGTGAAVSK